MKKKILIIEDYKNIVEVLTMRLNAMGYAVISAKDGQEGLTLARKEKPDLIVLDVTLPKINGYKISRLLKFDSRYKDIPIIMLPTFNLLSTQICPPFDLTISFAILNPSP